MGQFKEQGCNFLNKCFEGLQVIVHFLTLHDFLYSLFRQARSSTHDRTKLKRPLNIPVASSWVDGVA